MGPTKSLASALLASLSTLATLTSIDAARAGAVVGETPQVQVSAAPAKGLDAMGAEYKRPATIPFLKDNPFTAEKASLGKKF
jgi:cytochrome c peroxidase